MAAAESSNHQVPNFQFTQIDGSQLNESQESSESDSEVEEFEVPSAGPFGVSSAKGEDFGIDTVKQHNTVGIEKDVAVEERGAAQSMVTFSPQTAQVKEHSRKSDSSPGTDRTPQTYCMAKGSTRSIRQRCALRWHRGPPVRASIP